MTTITTAMLRSLAHTLALPIDDVRQFAFRNGVTIDDTPADTEEQTMAMTITQEQHDTAQKLAKRAGGRFVLNDGITITPAKPPEMVKLASAADIRWNGDRHGNLNGYATGYLHALQHAVAKAEKPLQSYADPVTGDVYIHQRTYLREIGAGGRDAG